MAAKLKREDLDFARDSAAAVRDAAPRGSTVFLFSCAGLVAAFLLWAHYAELDEVTRGEGRVIPSSRTQVIQSLEGGIVKELAVREGDSVKKGQIILRIDDTGFSSDLGELTAKELVLTAQIARLRSEVRGDTELPYPASIASGADEGFENEKHLFDIRRQNLQNQLSILTERLEQRQLELAELRESRKRDKDGLAIAQREFDIIDPLARQGIVSKTDVLKLEREMSNLKGQLATTAQSIPRVEAAIREAQRSVDEQRFSFRQTAQSELNEKLAELAIVRQSIMAAKDRVVRTDLRSPVDGIVNKVLINTIGGVVRAGEPILEITPIEDTLLVEVRVNPKDIAFISSKQNATVKISAYDFTIYGSLEGSVEVISSDSFLDEVNKENYYKVTIRTKESSLQKGNEILPIIPGMVATADIITGKKSVLDYILKPIVKARHEALRER